MKCDLSLSLVNVETNTTLQTRTLPKNQQAGRVEFDCSCFLYAGAFRFLLRQTSITTVSNARGSNTSSKENTAWWWSSELQVQWPTFHIAVERVGNHSGSFQVGISTSEHFQACSSGTDSDLFLEVSYVEYNQIGRNSIDKVRARTRHPIRPLRSQSIELSCAFPFTERDFIRVALRSPHTTQEVKSSGPLYLSRIFSYKLLVENAHAYKSGCEGTMTVKLITPPCVAGSSAVVGFGPEEQSSPPLAFNWLTQGENETEFNCSVFYPGRNKYCFRFKSCFNACINLFSPAESWGPWQPWSMCSVSCGEGVRERERECLLPSGVGGLQCTGMVKEQSLCSLEDCAVAPAPSPSAPPVDVGVAPLGGNMVVVAGISLCLAVIMVTIVVTVWRKFCQTPQCSSVRRGSMHSPGGRKLSDEASICGHSLQRPSLSDGHGPSVGVSVGISQTDRPPLGGQPLSQTLLGKIRCRCLSRYRLAQQQLKEMKKKGLKEATQLYHVSSSPVHDTVVETSATPTSSPIPTPTADWVEMVERSGLNPNFRRTSSFNDTKLQQQSSAQFRERSMTQVTQTPLTSYLETILLCLFLCYSPERATSDLSGFVEKQKTVQPVGGGRELVSGIGGPATGPPPSHGRSLLEVDRAQRAEQNWNRRGPSPIQRNMLARKLKEAQAQASSGVKGRQRSSTFSVSSMEQRRDRCRSLPMPEDYSSGAGSSYRLSKAEQRMLDLDLSSTCVGDVE
uniref:Thrombospondin, type I, domain containing 1 n=1 Tax=Salarias fasciatus TaxID=181472 RepID=A0A672HBJ3_SALFA